MKDTFKQYIAALARAMRGRRRSRATSRLRPRTKRRSRATSSSPADSVEIVRLGDLDKTKFPFLREPIVTKYYLNGE